MKKGFLLLEDGNLWSGTVIGNGEEIGEIIFYTGVVGYQEVLTDPSYYGKIVVMTYPHIGNYGINKSSFYTNNVWVKGLIVKELSKISSNWNSIEDFLGFIKRNKILVIEGIDTQEITSYLRVNGVKRAIITTKKINKKNLLMKMKSFNTVEDKVKYVTCKEKYSLGSNSLRIVAVDLGIIKPHLNVLSTFSEIIVVPYETKSEEILAYNPDGIFISSGPGNPDSLKNTVLEIKKLIGKKPILGIGLGMLVLSLSIGAKIFKMKCGHYGINQPVKNLFNNLCLITTQAHIYSLSPDSLVGKANIWFKNINDGTVEGIINKKLKILGVQFYPSESDEIWNKFKEFMNAKEK